MGLNSYEIRFSNVGRKQIKFLERVFDDFSWGAGLAAEEMEFDAQKKNLSVKFGSPKAFVPDESGDSENNLLPVLADKEQLFSTIYYGFLDQGVKLDKVNVVFIDNDGKEWTVTLGKSASIEPVS